MSFDVKHITYRYTPKGKTVLDDVTFTIGEGQITAVVGPSGSGKTTLVNVLSGVIPALEQNGVLEGELDFGSDALVSVVSQTPEDQLFGYGVEDAIAFGVENMGISSEEISDRIEYVLDLLNLQYLRKRSVAALSGGQRQAVCIASVLAMKPDILIMDEPVSSLDPNGKNMVRGILNQLKADGTTVLIVDNNLDWSAGIVDKVMGLDNGKIVFDGLRDDFFKDFPLQETLGVTIPQEVEIYRALSSLTDDIGMFYNMRGAERELDKIFEKRAVELTDDSETADDPYITVHQLNKFFEDGYHALKDINAAFPKGKVVAIMGQNGSGKTTLVKHLNGIYKPTTGDVRFMGESILKKTVAQISRNIILVFQHPEHMLFEQTVRAEISFCAKMHGLEFSPEKVDEVLKKYDLYDDAETFPVNLSMGKKHLLTILSVLFSSSDVIILDEPTLGMDLLIKNQLEDIIRGLRDAGKTVIIISHEIPLVFRNADEAIILNKSEKIYYGTIKDLALRDDIFEFINISLPPVVQLSKRYNFDKVCFNVEEFKEEAQKLLGKRGEEE